MTDRRSESPLRIRLSAERREALATGIQRLFVEEFDREISNFQTDRLIDFMLLRLGAPVYNQAIQDARGFLLAKLEDLDGDFYEPEEPR